MNRYLVINRAGPDRDLSRTTRQQAYWDEHATFINALIDDGFILLGGPLPDEGGAILVVQAESAEAARKLLAPDPWLRHGILVSESISRWEVFVDMWETKD